MSKRVSAHKSSSGTGSRAKEQLNNVCHEHVYIAFDSRNSAEVEGALLHGARAILARLHLFRRQRISFEESC